MLPLLEGRPSRMIGHSWIEDSGMLRIEDIRTDPLSLCRWIAALHSKMNWQSNHYKLSNFPTRSKIYKKLTGIIWS